MKFTLDEICNALGETAFDRGQEYVEQDLVLALRQDDTAIHATVREDAGQVFTQRIEIHANDESFLVDGACTCASEHNCEHVAAVLIELLRLSQKHWGTVKLPISSTQKPAQVLVHHAMPDAKKESVFRLFFVLMPVHQGRALSLSPCKLRLQVNGGIVGVDPIRDARRLLNNPPSYLQAADSVLVESFAIMQGTASNLDPNEPQGTAGAALLQALLEQNKLLWADSNADLAKANVRPLQAGPARHARLGWHGLGKTIRLAWQFVPEYAPALAQAAEAEIAANAEVEAEVEADLDSEVLPRDQAQTIDYVMPTEPPFYLDRAECGALTVPLDAAISTKALLALVSQLPQIERQNAVPQLQHFFARGLGHLLPLPDAQQEAMLHADHVEKMLLLGSVASKDENAKGVQNPVWHDYAMLVFDYDGQQVTIDSRDFDTPAMALQNQGWIDSLVRDQSAEREAAEQLRSVGFLPAVTGNPALGNLRGALVLPNSSAWLRFARETVPVLEDEGWHVKKMGNYRYNLVEVDDWYATVGESGGNAWFDLELGIVVNQTRVALLPVLIELIRSAPHDFNPATLAQHADTDELMATLPGGLRVALPWGRVKPILNALGELYFSSSSGGSMRMSMLDAARLAELADSAHLRWMGGERLRAMGRKLSEFGGVEMVAAPKGLNATLRDYQSEGLAWMQFLREYNLAGILADDMGLGKTIQTLAHILTEKEAGRLTTPALVVAPTSLMGNWQDEAARFAPDLRVLVLHGIARQELFDQIDQFDMILTTYALLPRDEEKLRAIDFYLVILDEAHYIKNPRAKAAQTAGLLRAKHRLCLTGTPLENHLGELWSQFHFLLPGLLGEEKAFNRDFRNPIEKLGDDARRAFLTRRIKPFMLRRTKDKVAKELPSKTEMVRTVELADAQRDLYETMRLAMDKKVRDEIAKKGVARSHIIILEALLKLRQVCCDPRLVKTSFASKSVAPSAKLIELLAMLDELLAENRKILVFSQFTSMLALIEDELNARNIPYALLTGNTVDRAGAVRSFQNGEVPVFLISLKAGGVGLNLTAADTVIHYDPWWNPAAENQATDRAWRLGQDKPVFVYKLIARGTLEEKIQQLQQKKAALADAMLADGQVQNGKLTQDDLQAIFAPLEA